MNGLLNHKKSLASYFRQLGQAQEIGIVQLCRKFKEGFGLLQIFCGYQKVSLYLFIYSIILSVPTTSALCSYMSNFRRRYLRTLLRFCPHQNVILNPPLNLGLPLSIYYASAADCQQLLEFTLARLEGWEAQLLSYGGRVKLVRAVIAAITPYWLQAVLINDSIIKKD